MCGLTESSKVKTKNPDITAEVFVVWAGIVPLTNIFKSEENQNPFKCFTAKDYR